MPGNFVRRFSKKIFITINLLTAVAFLVGCYNHYFFSEIFWPVGLLTLSSFYLFVALFIFFIFWLIKKSSWAFIFIVTTVLAIGPIRNIIPLRWGNSFSQEKKKGDFRIMSWNVAQFDILYNKKKPQTTDSMLQLVNCYNPDIACFQEMVAGDTLVNLNTPYYKKYSFFSVYEFASKLRFSDYYFSYNFSEDFLEHQHFGIITFSKFPIINKKTIRGYPYNYNSIFQYIDIVKETDTFRIFNIHLQSLKFSPVNLEYIDNPSLESTEDLKRSKNVVSKFKTGFIKRMHQANLIKSEIDKSPYPVVLCGDFNDVPNSYAYQTIGSGLQNAFVEKGFGIGRTFSGIAPTLRIDNIFADKKFCINQFTRIPKLLSDHFPIMADINFKQ